MTKIIVHGGDAHLDDLLSACLVLSKDKKVDTIYRRDPTPEEINDSDIWKLDIGKIYNPEIRAFDHHIKNCDDCTFSLLLKYWGIWNKSREVYYWIETAMVIDSKGPTNASKLLDIPKKAFVMLDSFAERALIDLMEKSAQINETDLLFMIMRYIGDLFFKKIEEFDLAKEFIEKNAIQREIKGVPAIECLVKKPDDVSSSALIRALHRKKQEWFGEGGIMIYPNNRPNGSISVKRIDDDERVDFSHLKMGDGISFVHPSGFFIVLKNMCDYEMEQIIKEGIRKSK